MVPFFVFTNVVTLSAGTIDNEPAERKAKIEKEKGTAK